MEPKAQTWIDPEELAYPNDSFTRKGRAILKKNDFYPVPELPYGKVMSFKAKIADTYFSIPARFRFRGKTYKACVFVEDGVFRISPVKE